MGRIAAAGSLSRGDCIPEGAIHDLNGQIDEQSAGRAGVGQDAHPMTRGNPAAHNPCADKPRPSGHHRPVARAGPHLWANISGTAPHIPPVSRIAIRSGRFLAQTWRKINQGDRLGEGGRPGRAADRQDQGAEGHPDRGHAEPGGKRLHPDRHGNGRKRARRHDFLAVSIRNVITLEAIP
jgi:hypothetical protein